MKYLCKSKYIETAYEILTIYPKNGNNYHDNNDKYLSDLLHGNQVSLLQIYILEKIESFKIQCWEDAIVYMKVNRKSNDMILYIYINKEFKFVLVGAYLLAILIKIWCYLHISPFCFLKYF